MGISCNGFCGCCDSSVRIANLGLHEVSTAKTAILHASMNTERWGLCFTPVCVCMTSLASKTTNLQSLSTCCRRYSSNNICFEHSCLIFKILSHSKITLKIQRFDSKDIPTDSDVIWRVNTSKPTKPHYHM